MKKRFAKEKIITALWDANATSVAKAARKPHMSQTSIHRWRKQLDGIDISDGRWLKRIKEKNQRLKKLLVERNLEIEVMQETQGKKGRAHEHGAR
tara:strand:+ start:7965 stop:8249 length:285 start_codon:yes stop_codon:yes gene_type:complete